MQSDAALPRVREFGAYGTGVKYKQRELARVRVIARNLARRAQSFHAHSIDRVAA